MKRSRSLVTTLAWASALGCAACARGTPVPTPFAEPRDTNILITVDNQDFRDATLYANWNGTRLRVGSVTGKTTKTFSTPWRDYQVLLEVDFLGGGEMRAHQPIAVSAGEHIDFVILPQW